jgi:hypothetical protein
MIDRFVRIFHHRTEESGQVFRVQSASALFYSGDQRKFRGPGFRPPFSLSAGKNVGAIA